MPMSAAADKDIARTTRRWITRVLLVLAIGIPATFLIWRGIVSSQVNARLARVKAAGYPISGAELNAWYQKVPDEENAALAFLEACGEIQERDTRAEGKLSDWFRKPATNWAMPPELKTTVHLLVESNRVALEKLHQAARLSKRRYPADLSQGFTAELKHLTKIKHGANLLRNEAFDHIEGSKIDEAAESVRVIYRIGESLSEEPTWISQLVRFAIYAIGNSAVEGVLNRGTISPPKLRSLVAALEDADATRGVVRGLAGERAMAVAAFRFNALVPPSADDEGGENAAPRPMSSGAARFVAQASGIFERDLRFFLDTMETNLAIAAMRTPQNLEATNILAARSLEARRKFYFLSGLLLPAFEKTAPKQVRHEASVQLVRTALAVESYRAEHGGERPPNIDALVPTYLKQVPSDPFDGKALRYKLLEKGYVVYSIGPDGKDDGGKKPPAKRKSNDQESSDITISVER
jgi:hypothetical protein